MSLPTPRSWLVLTALVMVQAPMAHAADNGPSARSGVHVDRRIAQLRSGFKESVGVIVRPDGTVSWESLIRMLASKGITPKTQSRRANAIALRISARDLSWLEGLPGIESVSYDAPVAPAPLAAA